MTNLGPSSSATSPVALPRSPRHSTLPYLCYELAAILGFIVFVLFVSAGAYRKISGYLENNEGENGDDIEAGEGNNNGDGSDVKVEEKFLVIMAGEILMKPTFIATPISSSSSSFGSCTSGCTTSCGSSTEKSKVEKDEGKKQENDVSSLSPENEESAPNTEHFPL